MRFISFFGLLCLLAIAYVMSYHRSQIRMRTVLWGLGLQFLFAVIILQENNWSFVGMGVLGMLIMVFIWREALAENSRVFNGGVVLVAALLAGTAGYYLAAHVAIGITMAVIIAFMVINGRWFRNTMSQSVAGSLLVATTVGGLIQRDISGQVIFRQFSDRVASFLNLSDYGAKFMFGNLVDPQYFGSGDTWPGFGFQFAFKVLPTIIFFGAFMSILYYAGVMQYVIEAMSRFMRWTLGTSGAETLSCSANIFVGQTEAPLLIKPFLNDMTQSELLTIMVGGFATIAGGVLAAYVAMGVDAGNLVAASVMSAPAALVIGKIIYPETEHSITAGDVELPPMERAENVLDAASTGITDGLKLAVNVGAMLIGFIALIAVIDVALNWLDSLIDGRWLGGELVAYRGASGSSPITQEYAGYFPGSLQTLFGTILRPLAWVMGVPWSEADKVGNLLGIKLSLNELVAYGNLGAYIKEGSLSPRSQIIATFALCGFANFSSIGIQLGGFGAMAPNRRRDLSKVALKAMFGGAIASFTTATIAGMFLGG
jgi:CNT family concentrative nucleoside transporter